MLDVFAGPVSLLGPAPYPVTLLPIGSGNFPAKLFPVQTPQFLNPSHSSYYPPTKIKSKSVPKR